MAFFTGTPQADTFEADVRDATITAEVLIDASGNPVVQQDGITVEEDGRTVALTAELNRLRRRRSRLDCVSASACRYYSHLSG